MQDVDGTLQLILDCRLDRAQRFRGQNEGGHNRSPKGLWHSEALDAVIERNSKFLRQKDHHDQIKEQKQRVIRAGAHSHRFMSGMDRGRSVAGLREELTVAHGLNKQEDSVKAERTSGEKDFRQIRMMRSGHGSGEVRQDQAQD